MSENEHPVAPQIRGCQTATDFNRFLFDAANGSRHEADRFMTSGTSPWIARAYAEGWTHILRDIVAELCRRHMLRHGQFPTMSHLNELRINDEDRKAFKRLGASRLGASQ